jgi:hypothetical protein
VTFVIQQGGNNHFTLHKHMTCWWNIIMLLSWWSHQMCPFYSDCFNKYVCVCVCVCVCVFKNIIWIAIYKYINEIHCKDIDTN